MGTGAFLYRSVNGENYWRYKIEISLNKKIFIDFQQSELRENAILRKICSFESDIRTNILKVCGI